MLDSSKSYVYDSRKIKKGDNYICLPKGEQYIKEALENGAADVIHLSRKEFAIEANKYFDYPTKKVTLIGITGTNGKTSVANFVAQLLEGFGYNVLVIGTINNALTTPESWETLMLINQHIENGGTHVVLEVSSHGIDQYRVYGFDFDVKCLTNITQDHLDYHQTFEAYRDTKLAFMNNYPGRSIFVEDLTGVSAESFPQIEGDFHGQNVTAAIEICREIGMPLDNLMQFASKLIPPKGRFESIDVGQPYKVIVDFAHTPEALKIILENANKLKKSKNNKSVVVFGCGGDRDRKKRSVMGEIAEKHADAIIITTDNSRSESAQKIMSDIHSGISKSKNVDIIEDRKHAIRKAIEIAVDGDVVIIAGKGHESKQYESEYSYYYNDHDIATYEILMAKDKWWTNWEIDNLDAQSDVLFVSNQGDVLSKKEATSFKRILNVPSKRKIQNYLKKIKGRKIVVFENEKRHSLTMTLSMAFHKVTKCTQYKFREDKSLEYNLIGLTMIEQTSCPILIQMNPEVTDDLKQVISVVKPDVIIVGDIFTEQRVIPISTLKRMVSVFQLKDSGENRMINEQMSDLIDHMSKELKSDEYAVIPAKNWPHFYELIIKEIIQTDLLEEDAVIKGVSSTFLSGGWYQKVIIDNDSVPIFVLDVNVDELDIKQKVDYFSRNSNDVIHYLPESIESGRWTQYIQEIALLRQQKVCMIKKNMSKEDKLFDEVSSIKKQLKVYPNAIHLVWKKKTSIFREVVKEIL